MKKAPVVIVIGAGLSGLTCAIKLHEAGVPVLVLEASAAAGGRVAHDRYESYVMDRGFQVLLTAYPEAKKFLNYGALNLHNFYPGMMIWWKQKMHKFVMPFSHPIEALAALPSAIGSLSDKMQVLNLRKRLLGASIDQILHGPQQSVLELLQHEGFSSEFIDRFWRPLCGAFLLERELTTSSRVFEFIMRCYFQGDASLPVGGMGAIPAQLAERLPKGTIRYKSPVTAIQDGIVSLPQGETLGAHFVVVATESREAARLLSNGDSPVPSRSVTCVYYESRTSPIEKPFYVLNGEDSGIVNNVVVPSLVSRSYAAERHHLISCSILQDTHEDEEHELEQKVREHMREWFHDHVDSWRYLKFYRIHGALPAQTPDVMEQPRPLHVRQGIYKCGDYTGIASINGALESGRLVAEAILKELKGEQ